MTRLLVICEGLTEEGFVRSCLEPHLAAHDVYASYQTVGRTVSVDRVVAHIRRAHRGFDYVTTLVDYYGFRVSGKQKRADLEARIADRAQQALGAGYSPEHILPYVQMHEFEALLFSNVEGFDLEDSWTDQQRAVLKRIRAGFLTPEDIDDSPQTAPSKRIGGVFPGYERRKALYGPLIAENIGLDAIRRECPGFHAWLSRLESLSRV